jgi:hypothetical protein
MSKKEVGTNQNKREERREEGGGRFTCSFAPIGLDLPG